MITHCIRKTALLAFFGLSWAVLFLPQFASAADTTGSLSGLEAAMNQLVYDVSRSVVTVEASTSITTSSGGPGGDESVVNLVSSGIIYDSQGYILAAASSVIGHDRIFINCHQKLYPAQLVGIDHQTGLALLKLPRPIGFPVEFTSDQGCAGQMIIVMGNSYGVQASPSMGFCAGSRPDGELQFSAQMTSGAIGGGVFNLSGQCMGVITGGLGQTSNTEVGLALPAHRIQTIVEYLKEYGDRMAGYVGLTTADIEISPPIEIPNLDDESKVRVAAASPLVAPETQLTDLIDRAILVRAVASGSPAAQSGFQIGDMIFSCNGRYVNSALELQQIVHRTLPGRSITLGMMRGNTPFLVDVVVDSLYLTPSMPYPAALTDTTDVNLRDVMEEVRRLKAKVDRLEHGASDKRR